MLQAKADLSFIYFMSLCAAVPPSWSALKDEIYMRFANFLNLTVYWVLKIRAGLELSGQVQLVLFRGCDVTYSNIANTIV